MRLRMTMMMRMKRLLRDNGLLPSCIYRGYRFGGSFLLFNNFSVAFWELGSLLVGMVREWVRECVIGMEMLGELVAWLCLR